MEKLNCKSLMIGDLVLYGQCFAIIKELCNGYVTILCSINGQNEYVKVTYDNIEPIPLTKEILEKKGFKSYIPENHLETVYACQDISKAVADELYALWPYRDGSFYLLLRVDGKDMVRMDVHYVHQLQHALRICGITKEIDL